MTEQVYTTTNVKFEKSWRNQIRPVLDDNLEVQD